MGVIRICRSVLRPLFSVAPNGPGGGSGHRWRVSAATGNGVSVRRTPPIFESVIPSQQLRPATSAPRPLLGDKVASLLELDSSLISCVLTLHE